MKSKGSSKSGNERPGGAGRLYAFLIDVAGEDEGAADTIADLEKNMLRNPARNSTALTIVEVDRSTVFQSAPDYGSFLACSGQGVTSWRGERACVGAAAYPIDNDIFALGRRLPLGQRRLDWLVVAATGSEQIGALPRSLERFPPSQVLWAGEPDGTH
jgi:hypothetical protein